MGHAETRDARELGLMNLTDKAQELLLSGNPLYIILTNAALESRLFATVLLMATKHHPTGIHGVLAEVEEAHKEELYANHE